MSLINQALRKAQRDRTPASMATGEPSPGNYTATASSSMSPALVIGLIITVAMLIGLVAGLSIVVFKGDSGSSAAAQVAPPADSATPAGDSSTTTRIEPQITRPVPAESTAAMTPAIIEELRQAREATEAKALAEAKAAEEAAARAEEAQPREEIIEWLSASTISGVRLSGANSRVILNGQAFSVGDLVNFQLGLKILVIQETRVLFEDKNGTRYMKRL
ncbi:MAG: hypothetical protein EA353_01690 [Puniceicoccaceae bacterium]|nr:MAG: hypothetical protein EA353_01690 [Puniceicoccaceae bacterium]